MGKFVETIIDAVCSGLSGSLLSGEELVFEESYAQMANKIWSWFSVIGIGMTIIYFLFELNQRVTNEGRDFNLKSFMGPFIKLAMALVIISHGPGIASRFIEVGNSIIKEAENLELLSIASNVADMDGTDFLESITAPDDGLLARTFKYFTANGLAFVEKLIMVFFLFISWVITAVLSVVWSYKTIAYKIEFIFRVGVAPIALADCYNGFHSGALKYLKSILAMGVYGASFLVIPKIGNVLLMQVVANAYGSIFDVAGAASDLINLDIGGTVSGMVDAAENTLRWNALTILASCIVIPFAELGALSLCKQVAKEVLS